MWASVHRLWVVIPKWLRRQKKPHVYAWDENTRHIREEKVVKDVGYYARQCGYDIRDEDVETQDGYFLR
jgi:lysosomal acid lipase/cholesteryl ester hydrolase